MSKDYPIQINSSDNELEFVSNGDTRRRTAANKLANHTDVSWADDEVDKLLTELEIEVGEGTNRFLYEDEREQYCCYLAENAFSNTKTWQDICQMIIWLWSTWEAIGNVTGKSWWNITEQEKYDFSLLTDNKDQQLKSKFKYFDKCDRIFSYVVEEGENDEEQEQDADEDEGMGFY
ncbi:hypothetical protein K501DRAFT_328472 [Backusella circina FSU 941]|nr:hypothetical protein K501DRAFT_239528 [Backusella circina FSU 941]KAI8890489.1 hypothetical protein K501DRAFT_328472 [Backusella circina FSU 941]